MPALLVSTSSMKRNWSKARALVVLEEALDHALEVGVIAALFGGVAMLYSLGVLQG
jgi:hypothetical protein